ncbi:MAG: pyridoxamine 5'-phosphate oxidase family protein [bacterium]|nr:pyridoxamine 5'-phosphate oxidase family protein [bacterium]
MKHFVSDIAFTPAVKKAQEKLGSRPAYARMEENDEWQQDLEPNIIEFISERDSLYLGTASAGGRPYIQHRGGPRGFIRVMDLRTLAFADFRGNRQYISLGNLAENGKAYLFLMDYPNRRRLKIWGSAGVVEDDPALLDKVADPAYGARPERAFVFHIEAWRMNCPAHIVPRYTEAEIAPVIEEYRERIAALEAEVRRLREGR